MTKTNPTNTSGSGGPRVPRHLIDAYFDRELDGPARMELFALLRQDLASAREMERMQAAVDAVRSAESGPDLTARVMDRIATARGEVGTPVIRRRGESWVMRVLPVAVAAGIGGAVVLGLVMSRPAGMGTPPAGPASTASGSDPRSRTVIAPVPLHTAAAKAPVPLHQGLRPGSIAVRPLGVGGVPKSGEVALCTGSGHGGVFTWAEWTRGGPWSVPMVALPGVVPTASSGGVGVIDRAQSLVPSAQTAPASDESTKPTQKPRR